MKKIKKCIAAAFGRVAAIFKMVKDKLKEKGRLSKFFMSLAAVIAEIALLMTITAFSVSASVKKRASSDLITSDQAEKLEDIDCIIILGAGVRPDGTPSDMLSDRLAVGVELFERGVSDIILMSGDHEGKDYDEVGAMLSYALNNGILSEAVFCDHAGVCTYDSIYRAKEIFGAHRVVIVTQEYHLYRALYIAESIGLEAYGVSASIRTYSGQRYRDLRETAARFKDFYLTLFESKPKYLGDKIPLENDGSITH